MNNVFYIVISERCHYGGNRGWWQASDPFLNLYDAVHEFNRRNGNVKILKVVNGKETVFKQKKWYIGSRGITTSGVLSEVDYD